MGLVAYFFDLMSNEVLGRQGWELDGNSSNDSSVGAKDCPELGGIVLCEGITQPLELPLGLTSLGGSSIRRIISGVYFRVILPFPFFRFFTAFASTSAATIGFPVIKAVKRLNQDLLWFSVGRREKSAAFFAAAASRICWNFLAKKYLQLGERSMMWCDVIKSEGMKTCE